MSHKFVSRLFTLALVLAVGVMSFPVSAGPAPAGGGTHFVRVPAGVVMDAAGLGLTPRMAIAYESFHWLELGDADFARLAASGVAYEEDLGAALVHVRDFAFDPLRDGEPVMPDGMAADPNATGLRLVQFRGPIQDAWLAQLEALGMPMLQYYPNYSFLTWASAAQVQQAQAFEFVRWQGAFHPGYKMFRDLAGRESIVRNVDVTFYRNGDENYTIDSIKKLGGTIQSYAPAQPDLAFWDAIVAIDARALNDVARLDTVLAMSYMPTEGVLDDEMSSQIVAGNYTAGVPFVGYMAWIAANGGFDGSGVIWSITDTGVDYQHPDLNTRIIGGHDYPGCTPVAGEPGEDCGGGHGTHVAGIVGGDGTAGYADPQGFKYGIGVAPAYSIFAQNSVDNGGPWPPAGGWQEHSKWAVLANAIGGNQSWTTGEGTAHGYQASERTHDMIVQDGNFDTAAVAEPYIQVFSAGNSGSSPYTLTSPKEAKNIVTVAASMNYRSGSIDAIASYSSRGPAVDGRVKPDVTTPGDEIASTRNDTGGSCATAIAGTNNMYAYCSGTSMAAPHTSGAIAVVTEWWRSFNSGTTESPAMAKALLINGAVDMGTADIPNFNEGWGRVQLTNVISNGLLMVYEDQTHIFDATGQSYMLQVGVPNTSKPLKVTLVWTDAPGAVGANPALVNNLDLTVVNGANTYLGNHFSGGWTTTGGTADTLNNVENVYVQNPSGSATITIQATNIAGDGVLNNGDPTDQHFAIVCQNCSLGTDFALSATPSSQSVCAPASAGYTVNVGQILGFNSAVTLSQPNPPAGATATFVPNPVTPPGTSALTVGPTSTEGVYSLNIVGTTATKTHTTTVGLTVYAGVAGAPTLTAPANGAVGVSRTPTFTWTPGAGSGTYHIQVATDSGFTTIVIDQAGLTAATLASPVTLNTSTTYYWRVTTENTCGNATSAVFSFLTVAGPGDCNAGQVQYTLFLDDMEAGAGAWTHSGTGDTWALSTAKSHSPTHSWFAADPAAVSDQRLVSPAVVLPTGRDPLALRFWHDYTLESSSSGCYDGGILEVSTDAGATWTQLTSQILAGGYDGVVSSSFSNPLAGLSAWCNSTGHAWSEVIADLSGFAGQTVQLRYRLGSDTSVSREGWYVDDVQVQACLTPTAVEVAAVNAQAAAMNTWGIALALLAGVALSVVLVRRLKK